MKKILSVVLLGILSATQIFCLEYTLEDIALTYLAFIRQSNIFEHRKILFLNPNQNSYIHYGKYEFDSEGNIFIDNSEEINESDDSVYYEDGKIVGVRCGHNRSDFKFSDNMLQVKGEGWSSAPYDIKYVSENELRCPDFTILKDGNCFTVDVIYQFLPDYKFIFNEDSIEVLKLTNEGELLYKYIYDNHGILLKEIDCHRDNRCLFSYSGVNGYIREKVNLDSVAQYINDDFFRRIDKNGYLVYQNSDCRENNKYGYEELVILPCDDNDNILASVEEIAVPYPEKNELLEGDIRNIEDSELKTLTKRERSNVNVEKHQKLIFHEEIILYFFFIAVIVIILISFKRNKDAKK